MKTFRIALLLSLIIVANPLLAQYETIHSGDWDAPSTWQGGNIPPDLNNTQSITIKHSIIINSDVTVTGDLEFNKHNAALTIVKGKTFSVHGDIHFIDWMHVNVYGRFEVYGSVNQTSLNYADVATWGEWLILNDFTLSGNLKVDGIFAVGKAMNTPISGTINFGTNSTTYFMSPEDIDINIHLWLSHHGCNDLNDADCILNKQNSTQFYADWPFEDFFDSNSDKGIITSDTEPCVGPNEGLKYIIRPPLNLYVNYSHNVVGAYSTEVNHIVNETQLTVVWNLNQPIKEYKVQIVKNLGGGDYKVVDSLVITPTIKPVLTPLTNN